VLENQGLVFVVAGLGGNKTQQIHEVVHLADMNTRLVAAEHWIDSAAAGMHMRMARSCSWRWADLVFGGVFEHFEQVLGRSKVGLALRLKGHYAEPLQVDIEVDLLPTAGDKTADLP
jgi:hypothetical protein